MEGSKIKDKTWCVYIHTNKINNKVYIGITSQIPEKRWGKNGSYYKEKQPVFYNAIHKYGWNNFEHIIFAEGLTKEEAINMEIKLIALYKSNCKRYKTPEYGYNMTDGGEGNLGLIHSEETKQIIGKKAKERYSIPENNPMFGKHHSEETKKKMSEHRQGMNMGEDNSFYGQHHSENTKQKIREYALNRPKEVRQKVSQKAKERFKNKENHPRYGKPVSEKQRQQISEAQSKPVVQLSKDGVFLAEYKSFTEAGEITGVHPSSIAKCCSGTQNKGGDFIWILKEEYNPNKIYKYVNTGLKPVIQMDRNGKFISEYISCAEAERITGINSSDISRCCNHKGNSAGGFLWLYKKDYDPNINIVYKGRDVKRKIIQYDIQWNCIGEYNGCTHASKETGFDRHGISDCCNGKRETYCGFYWRYDDPQTIQN